MPSIVPALVGLMYRLILHEFVGETPWGHLDIAGTAYLSASRGDYLAQPGATGYGVRLIVELASSL